MPVECRRVNDERLTPRHLRDCDTSGCEGCEPCTARHCGCGRHLRDDETWTCARCVGRTRDDLHRIQDLCALAPTAAAEMGATENLLVLAGPVPRYDTSRARHQWAMNGGLCRCADCPDQQPMPEGPVCDRAERTDRPCAHHVCKRRTYRPTCPGLADWLEYADDDQHPLWVLGTWDMLVSEHLGHHARTGRVTIDAAATYLAANLTELARDREFGWDDLAREVRACRHYVERIMGVAEWVQRGAPCPACQEAGRTARPLERHYADGATDHGDLWVCLTRDCARQYDLDEYGRLAWLNYLDKATALTAPQIRIQYRVPEGSTRGWAAKGLVHKRGTDDSGRQLYDVADVVACRDRAAGERMGA